MDLINKIPMWFYVVLAITIFWATLHYGLKNRIKGWFLHKERNKEHFPIERYSGLTCTGFKCKGCGYEWYVNKKSGKKFHG